MLIILLLELFECLWSVSDLLIKPRMLPCDKIFEKEASCGKFDKEAYLATKKTNFRLHSDYGYTISCELLEPAAKPEAGHEVSSEAESGAEPEVNSEPEPEAESEVNSESESEAESEDGSESAPDFRSEVMTAQSGSSAEDRAVRAAVLVHGLGFSRYACLKFAEIYLKLGFKVVIFDQRYHGLSGGRCTTMGYYEKYDLKKVIDWCFRHFGKDCKIVTHGESMGAATVLLHLGIDTRVKCAIADCAYSDLTRLLKHQMKQYYHLPGFLIPAGSFLTFIRTGFWYKDVSPINAVRETDTPVMFIHGKRDNFVPVDMSKQMYAARKKNKAIYLVAGARHSESCCKNRIGYTQRVEAFLKRYIK